MEGAVTPPRPSPGQDRLRALWLQERSKGDSPRKATACRASRVITGREGHPPPLSEEGAGGEERATQRELRKELTLMECLPCARCCPVRELP